MGTGSQPRHAPEPGNYETREIHESLRLFASFRVFRSSPARVRRMTSGPTRAATSTLDIRHSAVLRFPPVRPRRRPCPSSSVRSRQERDTARTRTTKHTKHTKTGRTGGRPPRRLAAICGNLRHLWTDSGRIVLRPRPSSSRRRGPRTRMRAGLSEPWNFSEPLFRTLDNPSGADHHRGTEAQRRPHGGIM